ncbi:MAG: putative sulfate exporter family transporter, partial [Spirochaetia bacterium]|nr:putative sulfate exporter family transporter [Spirochaetia bacterium]
RMQGAGKNQKGHVQSSIPYFILLFLAMAGLNSLGIIPQELSALLKTLSKFLMVTALAAIGLKTSLADLRTSGGAAMAHGFIISLLVVVVAYLVIYAQQEVLLLI